MKHAVVVGGGPAGLAAAAYLGRGGWRTTLLEAGGALGGRAQTRTEAGAALNLGAHALYVHGHAKAVLDELGILAPGGTPRATHALRGGRLLSLPSGPGSLLLTRLLGWRAKLEVGALLGSLPKLDTATVSGSFAAWLERSLTTPDARVLLEALARLATYAHCPERVPAALVLRQLQLALPGVRYLDGGWERLTQELAECARAAGAELRLKAPVRGLRLSEGRVVGVELKQEVLAADAVVLALPPHRARALLEPHVALAETTPIYAACLDLALRSEGLERTVGFALGMDQPVYFSIHSDVAKLGPHTVAHLVRYLEPGTSPDPHALRAELEAVCDRLLPNWRSQAVAQVFAPRLLVAGDLPRDGLGARIAHDAAGVAGLALCGDWVGPEGWLLDASLASAKAAAQALARAPVLRRV